jgi:hypothetical protein
VCTLPDEASKIYSQVGLEIPSATTMKFTVVCEVTLCSLVELTDVSIMMMKAAHSFESR